MAIPQSITFEGRKYNLDDRDRVAAKVAHSALESETLSDSGAANPDIPITFTSNASGTDAITLADGSFVGQIKYFIHTDSSGTKSTITPANTVGSYASVDFAIVGDTISLVWSGSGWAIIGRQSGVANSATNYDGPVVA